MSSPTLSRPATVQQVKDDIKDAMRARDAGKDRLRVLRYAMAKAADKAKARPKPEEREVTDADVLAAIQTQVKEIQDKVALVSQHGGTVDPVDGQDLSFLSTYLPQRMDEATLQRTLEGILAETENRTPSVRGFVNKALRERHAGQYDSAQVARLLDALLKP